MTFKIAVCAGHGGFGVTPGKRTPDNEYEWNFNDKVVRAFIAEIKKYENVEVRRFDDPTGKTDVPLRTRTNKANAWGADIYISFHHNANTGRWGNWTGVEVFYSKGSTNGQRLANLVLPEVVRAYGLKNRGLKNNSLHITRETKMPAILVEGGFMDSLIDIKKLRDDNVLRNAGIGVANGVVKYAKLKKKPTSTKPVKPTQPKPIKEEDEMLEKAIVINSFADFPNAEILALKLKAPIYMRKTAEGTQVAKEVIVVGGNKNGLKADKFTVLSGKDRFETAVKVAAYLK